MILDLVSAWFIHWLEHQVPWMWGFHLIHHSDTNVDVTTALRHHPGESVFRAVFTVVAIFVAGVPVGILMIYQTLSALFSQFNHANIKTPPKLDWLLSYLIVTPGMHKVHHHYKLPLTNTNYGNIFAVWDRIFGTFAHAKDPSVLRYGINGLKDPAQHSSIIQLVMVPFRKR